MIELDDMFLDSFTRLLDDVSDPAAVRAAEADGETAAIWEAVNESGFVDALVPEAAGGAGFATGTVVPLVMAAGERLLPVAFAQTMVARMLAARAGAELGVEGPVTLWPLGTEGRLRSQAAPPAWEAGHALTQQGSDFAVVPLTGEAERDGFGYIPAKLSADAEPLAQFSLDNVDLLDWAAAVNALLMAGACEKVLAMSIDYLNERKQFGRPLSKFQALQHMAAQMAEQSVLASTAARIGFTSENGDLSPLRVATAKTVAFEAAAQCSAFAHAVFAAIGITEEYDLQLFVRALKRWQVSFGSEAYWARSLGRARIAADCATSADFIRERLAASPAA